MFDGRWRAAVDRSTGPVGQALHRRGVTADVLTATGLLSATATAVSVATGHLHLAILLLIVTGLHDLLDGPVAKAAGTASVRGAFFDSVTDRVADAVLMLGCAWYLVDRHEGHTALLPMGILAVTALISYERAKAESLGLSAKGGLMERAERMVVLGFAFLGAAFFVPVLWLLFVLVSITAATRFVKVWNAASGRDEVLRRRIEAWREGRVDSRWRAWREGRTTGGVPRREPARRTTRSTGVSVRWRARRQEALSSRSGRARRERRERPRAARHAAGSASSSSRSTFRRTRSPSSPSSSSSSSGSGSGSTS
jgi:CDP-diacylglycerol--glycerol-3-phosphate 3-phosphatidyltransferase